MPLSAAYTRCSGMNRSRYRSCGSIHLSSCQWTVITWNIRCNLGGPAGARPGVANGTARIMRPMADASPLCSVIIPAYQAGEFVAQTIQSVLDQTYPSVEVIVVDDGSTDDTADVVAAFGDAVRLCRQANGGPSGARNTGLGLAQGE